MNNKSEHTINQEDIIKADLAKLHAEVNQLRNNEFLLCSFAIGLFGAIKASSAHGLITNLGVLLVLSALFYWHYTLTDTRSRIISFMQVTERSEWEMLYRQFADKKPHSSQRHAGFVVFFIIGWLQSLAIFDDYNELINCNNYYQSSFYRITILAVCIAFVGTYIFVLTYIGYAKKYKYRLIRYRELWQSLINNQ